MLLNRRNFISLVASEVLLTLLNNSAANGVDALNSVQLDKNPVPKGLFCVTNTANWVIQNNTRVNLFDFDVDGISNYSRWADVEKKPGRYDWLGFERMMDEATKVNKKLAYHIIPGIHTPDWAYQAANIVPYEYSYTRANPKKVKTYLPWTEKNGKRIFNTGMIQVWRKTVKAFSYYLRNHPKKKSIAYVAITGGPTSNGLEVMWAQEFYGEFKTLRWDKEVEILFVEYWKRIIDIFIEAFPDIPLGLAFADFFGVTSSGIHRTDYEIPKSIVNYALKKSAEQNVTIVPMGLWIGAIDPSKFDSHPLVHLLRSFNVPFALQGPMSTYSYERLQKILSFAVSSGASWVELWHHDILNKDYNPLFREYRQLLMNIK